MKENLPLIEKVTFRVRKSIKDYLQKKSSDKTMVLKKIEEYDPEASDFKFFFFWGMFVFIISSCLFYDINSLGSVIFAVFAVLFLFLFFKFHYKKVSFNITVGIYLKELSNIFQERVQAFDDLFSDKNLRYKVIKDKEKKYQQIKADWKDIQSLSDIVNDSQDLKMRDAKLKSLEETYQRELKPVLDAIKNTKISVNNITDKLKLVIKKIKQKKKIYELMIAQDEFTKDVKENLRAELNAFFESVFAELQTLPQLEEDVKAIHSQVLSNLDNANIDKLADFYNEIEDQFSLTNDLVQSEI